MNAILAGAQIHGAGAKGIAGPARHESRQIGLARDHLHRWMPTRPKSGQSRVHLTPGMRRWPPPSSRESTTRSIRKSESFFSQRENPVRDFFNRFGGSGLRLASYFDGGPLGTLSLLICHQQPKESIVSNTSVADECCKTYYGTFIGICTAESEADDPSCHRSRNRSLSVFLIGHFTLPLTVRTTVGANEIKERGATTDRAVAQHRDATIATFHAVQSLRPDCVKPVSNHIVAPVSPADVARS